MTIRKVLLSIVCGFFSLTAEAIQCEGEKLRVPCCSSDPISVFEVTLGWRQDHIDWKSKDIHESGVSAKTCSDVHFKDLGFYTIGAKAMWMCGSCVFRLSASYGVSHQGKMKEHLDVSSSYLSHTINDSIHFPVKRRNNAFDVDAAFGIPFTFCQQRLFVLPLIGFSYAHQNMTVKSKHRSSGSYGYCCDWDWDDDSYSCSSSSKSCYGSSFDVERSNPFHGDPSQNPFDPSSSPKNFASLLGLYNCHRGAHFHFTWYGFYIGSQVFYAWNPCWTVWGEIDLYFWGRCNRKRHSWIGIHAVDHLSHKGNAYGGNGTIGLNYDMGQNWYATTSVLFKGWHAKSTHHDHVNWHSFAWQLGLGYIY